MYTVNKVILVGNLGKDPTIQKTKYGKMAILTIATSENTKGTPSDARKERTEWHRVVIMNEKLTELAEKYLKKGAKVYLEGQLRTSTYKDKAGMEKWMTQVVLTNYKGVLTFLSKKEQKEGVSEFDTPLESNDVFDKGTLDKGINLEEDPLWA